MIIYDNNEKKYVIIPKMNNINYYQKIINMKYGINSNKQPVNIPKMIYDKIKMIY